MVLVCSNWLKLAHQLWRNAQDDITRRHCTQVSNRILIITSVPPTSLLLAILFIFLTFTTYFNSDHPLINPHSHYKKPNANRHVHIHTHTPSHVTKTTTMGLLDPVYNAVSNTVKGAIAGGGAVAGDTVSGLGSTISSTGRGIGDSVSGISRGWGDYAKDTGNYVKDYTKAPGKRSSTAANPLGLGSGGLSKAVPLRVESGGRPPAAKRTQTGSSSAIKRPTNSRQTLSSSEILANRVRAQMNAKAATPRQPAKKNEGRTTTGKAEVKKGPAVAKKK